MLVATRRAVTAHAVVASNAVPVATIACAQSARNASIVADRDEWQAELDAYTDSREYRDLNRLMRCNRNRSFS